MSRGKQLGEWGGLLCDDFGVSKPGKGKHENRPQKILKVIGDIRIRFMLYGMMKNG